MESLSMELECKLENTSEEVHYEFNELDVCVCLSVCVCT